MFGLRQGRLLKHMAGAHHMAVRLCHVECIGHPLDTVSSAWLVLSSTEAVAACKRLINGRANRGTAHWVFHSNVLHKSNVLKSGGTGYIPSASMGLMQCISAGRTKHLFPVRCSDIAQRSVAQAFLSRGTRHGTQGHLVCRRAGPTTCRMGQRCRTSLSPMHRAS